MTSGTRSRNRCLNLNSEVGRRDAKAAGVGQTFLSASWGDFLVALKPDWKLRRWSFYICPPYFSRGTPPVFISSYHPPCGPLAMGDRPLALGQRKVQPYNGWQAGLESPANRQAGKPAPRCLLPNRRSITRIRSKANCWSVPKNNRFARRYTRFWSQCE